MAAIGYAPGHLETPRRLLSGTTAGGDLFFWWRFRSRTPGPPPFVVHEFDLKSSMPSCTPSIKLGLFRKIRLLLALPLSLFQPEPWASAILVNELDPSQLKCAPNYRKRGVTRFRCLTFE